MDENIIGVVFRDRVDNDYGWALMVRHRLGRFRGVHLDVSVTSMREAEAGLRHKIAEVSSVVDLAELGIQGDETNAPVDLLTPIPGTRPDQLHPYFVELIERPGRAPARTVLREIGPWLTAADPYFVREFQRHQFDQRLWELYLWATFREGRLGAHVRALAWIGGCPEMLVPDNLKGGVTNANYYDPVINRSYHELARHYGIAVLPARVRRPRDKSSVESSVNLVERWVLAPLRHRQLFGLEEANKAILEQVEILNARPFSPPREGSRRSLFEAIERTALKPLPAEPFAIGQWLSAGGTSTITSLLISTITPFRIACCTAKSMCFSRQPR